MALKDTKINLSVITAGTNVQFSTNTELYCRGMKIVNQGAGNIAYSTNSSVDATFGTISPGEVEAIWADSGHEIRISDWFLYADINNTTATIIFYQDKL